MPAQNRNVNNPSQINKEPTVKDKWFMFQISGDMRKALKKNPQLGDEWVKKQLDNVNRSLLYSPGIADAIRKGWVKTESSYLNLPSRLEWEKKNPDIREQSKKARNEMYSEEISRKYPEQEVNLKRINELLGPKYEQFIPQMGEPLPGQEDLNNILSGLSQRYQQRYGGGDTSYFDRNLKSFDVPEWMPSGQDIYGGLRGGAESLYGGARSGLEGLYNMGQSGMQGLQNLYNNWSQPSQVPQQQMDPRQRMEETLAMLNNPASGMGGKIKQGRM